MEAASDTNPRQLALTNALLWSVINITIFLLVYYVKPDLMGSFVWSGVQFVIAICLAIYFCLDLRKKIGGYWTFRQALSHIFLMFFIQAMIVFFFTIIFAKYIEPAYVEKMKEISTSTMTRMLESMGMEQDKIDEAVAQNQANMAKQLNPGFKELLFGLSMVTMMYFIGALIFAAIFKKDPPIFSQKEEE